MRSALRAAAIGLLLALGVGCHGDDGGAVEGPVPSVTTTTRPSTTTTAAPATTTTVAACPKVAVATDVDGSTSTAADLDGDGRPDEVRGWHDGDWWLIHADLTTGGEAEERLPHDDSPAGVAVIGGHDLDADGTDELWVRVGAGASAQILGLYRLDGCDLESATLDGQPVELPVGGSVGTASGVSCPLGRDVSLVTTTLSSTDGGSYDVTTTFYRYADGVLVEFDDARSVVTADNPDFDAATSFSCGDLSL